MPAQTRIIHYYVCLGAAGGKEWKVNMKIIVFTNDSLTGKFVERKICNLSNVSLIVIDRGVRQYTNKILKRTFNSTLYNSLMLFVNSMKNDIDKRIYHYEHDYIKNNNMNIKRIIREIPCCKHVKKIYVDNINDDRVRNILQIEKPDLVFVFGTAIIKSNILKENENTRFINIHFSILPKYRGAKPEFWALYNYDFKFVGVTIHLLDYNIDSGPILCQKRTLLGSQDNYIIARFKNILTLNSLLEDYLNEIIFDRVIPIEQTKAKLYLYSEFTREKRLKYWESFEDSHYRKQQ